MPPALVGGSPSQVGASIPLEQPTGVLVSVMGAAGAVPCAGVTSASVSTLAAHPSPPWSGAPAAGSGPWAGDSRTEMGGGCPKRLCEPPASPHAPTVGFYPPQALGMDGTPQPQQGVGVCMRTNRYFCLCRVSS